MAFPFVALALFLLSTGINLLLRPRIKRPRAPGQERPTAQEGRPIPQGFGVFAVAPNVVFWNRSHVDPATAERLALYSANMVVTLCQGEVDALLDLQAGGKSLRFEPVTREQTAGSAATAVITPALPIAGGGGTPTTFAVNARAWFGGNASGGGWQGEMRCHWGALTQTVGTLTQAYYTAATTDGGLGRSAGSTRPGICFLEFGTAATPFYWGTSPAPQDFTVLLQKIPRALLQLNLDADYTSAGLTDAEQVAAAAVGPGNAANPPRDANPAEIIYALLTHATEGLGWDPDLIDLDALVAMAITCRHDELGLSCLFTDQDEVEDMVDDVLKHVDGLSYWHPVTGLFTVALARPLAPAATPTVVTTRLLGSTYANARDLTIERPNWRETTNDLTLTYRRFETGPGGGITGEVLTEHATWDSQGNPGRNPGSVTYFRYYQVLGRNIALVRVYANGVELAIGTDWELSDSATGMILVWESGAANTGDRLTVDYVASPASGGYVEAVARAQNLASIQQSEETRSLTVDYPFFTNELVAGRHVAKLLNQLSRPLLRGQVTIDRTGYALHPGSVISLSHSVILDDGSEYVILDALQARIGEVDYGTLEDGAIRCSWVEDVYAESVTPILPPPPPPPANLGTCPAIAIGYAATSAIRVCLYPSDSNFTVRLWRASSDLGLGITTGATLVSDAILGTASYYDDTMPLPSLRPAAAMGAWLPETWEPSRFFAGNGVGGSGLPWDVDEPAATVMSVAGSGMVTGAVWYYAAQLIRPNWTAGPLTPWQSMTATAGTPGSCTCTIPAVTVSRSNDGVTGTMTIVITDAQNRVQSVEFNTISGTAPESGWVEDTTAPYTTTVTINGTASIRYRVTYLACDGSTATDLTGTATFPVTATTSSILEVGEFVYESGNPLYE